MSSQDIFNKLDVSIKNGVSKKSGSAYVYVSLKINDTEIDRMFIKPTELEYYQGLEGVYNLVPEEEEEVK